MDVPRAAAGPLTVRPRPRRVRLLGHRQSARPVDGPAVGRRRACGPREPRYERERPASARRHRSIHRSRSDGPRRRRLRPGVPRARRGEAERERPPAPSCHAFRPGHRPDRPVPRPATGGSPHGLGHQRPVSGAVALGCWEAPCCSQEPSCGPVPAAAPALRQSRPSRARPGRPPRRAPAAATPAGSMPARGAGPTRRSRQAYCGPAVRGRGGPVGGGAAAPGGKHRRVVPEHSGTTLRRQRFCWCGAEAERPQLSSWATARRASASSTPQLISCSVRTDGDWS